MRSIFIIGILYGLIAGCGTSNPAPVSQLGEFIQEENITNLKYGLVKDSVNVITKDSVSLLTLAIRNASEEAVEVLIEKGADVNLRNANELASSPLMEVSALESTAIAAKLIDAGAQVNMQDKQGDTALNWGCYVGNKDFAKLLLDAGADPFIKSKRADHAILAAQQTWNERVVAMFFKEQKGLYRVEAMQDALLKSVEENNVRNFYLYADSLSANLSDEAGTTLLGIAATHGATEIARQLILWGAAVDSMNPSGHTPLARAARFGQVEMVDLLLRAGANVNKSNSRYNMTPLMACAIGGHIGIGEKLLKAGASVSMRDGIFGFTPSDWAKKFDQDAFVDMLSQYGRNFTALSK